jgi:hypothetical protein
MRRQALLAVGLGALQHPQHDAQRLVVRLA